MIKFKIINLRELCRGIYNKCRSSLHEQQPRKYTTTT